MIYITHCAKLARILRPTFFGVLLIGAIVLLPQVASACPTCKDGLEQTANNVNLVRGYFWSILFMMAMPFVILGGLGSYMYFEVCRARADAARLSTEVL